MLARSLDPRHRQVVIADVDMDQAEKSVRALHAMGFEAAASKCDVRIRSDVDAAVKTTVQCFGGLDIAVANAGEAGAGILG